MFHSLLLGHTAQYVSTLYRLKAKLVAGTIFSVLQIIHIWWAKFFALSKLSVYKDYYMQFFACVNFTQSVQFAKLH